MKVQSFFYQRRMDIFKDCNSVKTFALLLKRKEVAPIGCLEQSVAHLGPVVKSVVSLTSSLRVISLTVLADSIYNILIFFAEKM